MKRCGRFLMICGILSGVFFSGSVAADHPKPFTFIRPGKIVDFDAFAKAEHFSQEEDGDNASPISIPARGKRVVGFLRFRKPVLIDKAVPILQDHGWRLLTHLESLAVKDEERKIFKRGLCTVHSDREGDRASLRRFLTHSCPLPKGGGRWDFGFGFHEDHIDKRHVLLVTPIN